MTTIELTNSFHNTSTKIKVDDPNISQWDAWMEITEAAFLRGDSAAKAKVRRIHRALCGVSDCKCGTVR